MDWNQLEQACMQCRQCALNETRHHVVFGVGNQNSPVLLVGEGPGEQEDLQGVPFVGPAGQLLDDMLELIDLDRSRIYIANVIKCRPPRNRDPLNLEQDACRKWLDGQMALLNPKIVVCLGRIAAQRMIRSDFSVTKEHGQFIEKNGILFMGTFHPAALLRGPQNKPNAFADFVALRDKIHEVCEHTYE